MKNSTSGLLHRSFSEYKFNILTRVLFGISILLILTLSYSYRISNQKLIFYSQKTNETQTVITGLKIITASIYEANFLSNNYLFLKDTAYTNKTLAAIKNLPQKTNILDSLTQDNAPQLVRLKQLKTHLNLFYKYTSRLADSQKNSTPPFDQIAMFLKKNKEIDEMFKLITEMEKVEYKLLDTRIKSRDGYMKKTSDYSWIIVTIALIFLLIAFTLLDFELRRNKVYRVELENKVENLNRSNSELEQFAYVASHDLQEPLRKIRSFSDRIVTRHHQDLSSDSLQLIQKIEASSKKMQSLIQDLLAFSRIVNTGHNYKMVNLNTSLLDAKTNLSELISENNGSIISDPLPTIEAYQSQMMQLFQNIISNAMKYRKDNVRPVLKISHRIVRGYIIPNIKTAHQDIDFHQIKFSDNGIGFSNEFNEKIFIIFQRLHDRSKFAGSGIGLAISKRIVSNHNGYIFAESKVGIGTNFFIYLPAESLLT